MNTVRMFRVFVAFLLLAVCPAKGGEITVAAASDLKFALDELIGEFHEKHPETKVKVSYGASGNFHAQIRNGAPYDIYFSADIEYPRKLAEAGMALDGEVFRYAVGRVVVWVPEKSPIDVEKLGIRALEAEAAKRIAIANPRHAPYGAAAVAAMKKLGVYESVEKRLVLGENIAQAAQFVQSGAADIGVIALSLAMAPQMEGGKYWTVPLDAYPKLEQGGMILKATKSPKEAKALRDFVFGEHGRGVLKRYGFSMPEKE